MNDKIHQLIADQLWFKLEEITDEKNLADDLGMDSLDCVELVMVLEDELSIIIPDEDAEKFLTVKNITDYIESKKEKR